MLKKVGSFFINCFTLLFVGVLSIFVGVRLFFEPVSMSVLVEHLTETESFWEDIDVGEEEFKEFIDEDEFNKIMGEFVSDYLKYSGGVKGAEKPSLDPFMELIEDSIDAYEKETGTKFDRSEIDAYLNELEESMDEELFSESPDADIKMVFSVIYSNVILFVLVVIILGFIALNYLVRKNLSLVSLQAGIVVMINTVICFALSLLLNLINEEDILTSTIVAVIQSICNRISLVGLIIGILLIVVFVLLKKKYPEQNNQVNNNYNNMNGNYNNNMNNNYNSNINNYYNPNNNNYM